MYRNFFSLSELPFSQAAFILNPTLSCQELLATLCDQLKIRYRKTGASLKTLTDKISEKLIKNHDNDINTLLIIDEAQHLQPEVLEQLRLLTNLETNTKKLLQVILIGQPELQQLLQRRDLRQLAQRITARYHLMPLTKQELAQYVEHRLTVADCVRPLFEKGALTKIHQLSQGVPRLINLLCHSALMLAYNQNDSVVNKKTVIAAGERALGVDVTRKEVRVQHNNILIFATVFSVAAFFALAGFWWGQTPVKNNQLISSQESVINTKEQLNDTESKVPHVENSEKKLLSGSHALQAEQTGMGAKESIDTVVTNKESEVLTAKMVTTKKDSLDVVDNKLKNKQATERRTNKQVNEKLAVPVADKTLVVSANNNNLPQGAQHDANYQVTNVEGVSSDLLALFQAAVDETNAGGASSEQSVENRLAGSNHHYEVPLNSNDEVSIRPLTQMPQQLQNDLPSLQFEQHIYASDGQGWVNVNGRDRYEGDYIGEGLIVEKILPQQVILSFQGEKFSLPALTNW